MSIVPSVQNALFGIVVNLCGVGVVVGEGHPWNHLSVGVRVEGVLQVGVFLVVAVNSVQDAAHNEAVPIVVPPQPGSPGGLALHAEVRRVQSAQDDHLLQEPLIIQRRVDDPQAALVHGDIDVWVTAPLPRRRGLFHQGVVQHGPGGHVALPQVVLDDVPGEGAAVEEGPVVDHVARANPVVGKLVWVGEAAWREETTTKVSDSKNRNRQRMLVNGDRL